MNLTKNAKTKNEIRQLDYDTKLHGDGKKAWDSSDALLNWLSEYLTPQMRTLETGAGKSTLLFAEFVAHHIAITPSQREIDNIIAEANNREISLKDVTFYCEFSQISLPKLEEKETLDLVFIDGGHGFPIPAVDWLFTAPMLKIGGYLIIDDIDLWTGSMLVNFLKQEPEWQLVTILKSRTAIFEKIAPFVAREWCDQKYVARKSLVPQFLRKAKNAILTLLKADFKSLAKKIRQEINLMQK